MAASLDAARIRALLLDIEGTTTPIEFVYQELFPFARTHLRKFLDQNGEDPATRTDVDALHEEHRASEASGAKPPAWAAGSREEEIASAVAFAHWLMDRDSKSASLKSLQGKVWQHGYATGALRGKVYPDVRRAFARWRGQGRDICIYSSGSVLAQKLLFGSSDAGDLTTFIRAYFDTGFGAKKEHGSYRKIAGELRLDPAAILFVSDVAAELDAARQADLQTALAVRSGAVPAESAHVTCTSFDSLLP